MSDEMPREPRASDEAASVELDEQQKLDPVVAGKVRSPARVIPSNVGSLDDVSPDVVKGGGPIVDDEGA